MFQQTFRASFFSKITKRNSGMAISVTRLKKVFTLPRQHEVKYIYKNYKAERGNRCYQRNSCWHKKGSLILGVGKAPTDCMSEGTICSFKRFNLAINLETNALVKSFSAYFNSTLCTSDFVLLNTHMSKRYRGYKKKLITYTVHQNPDIPPNCLQHP